MKRGIFVMAVAAVLATGPGAVADPAASPIMTAAGGAQRGDLAHLYMGTHHKDDSCSTVSLDGDGRGPQAVMHDAGPLSWLVPDARRPQVTVEATPWLVPARLELPPDSLRVSLTPVRSRGKVVAWTATSEPVGGGDLRLVLTLRWPGPCSDGDEARWVYHVRSLPRRGA
jgi:hypothetical protein